MKEEVKKLIKDYQFEADYIDESFEDEIELFVIPLREYLQNYPDALDEIVEADKKLIESYEELPDKSYLKMILAPIYKLAKANVAAHKSAA